jgi:hypothetical protein
MTISERRETNPETSDLPTKNPNQIT